MKIVQANLKFKNPLTPLDPNKVEFIFIHHPMAITATPEQIHQWHLSNGWSGAGYNEYITKDGTVHILRGDHIGAHVARHNSVSYGICLEGNYDVEPSPSDTLYRIVAERVVETQKRFPKAKVILPHSARGNTACPGKNFSMGKLYDTINEIHKEGEKVEEIKTVDEALKVLVDAKIINSPDYWRRTVNIVNFIDNLLINMANYIVRR